MILVFVHKKHLECSIQDSFIMIVKKKDGYYVVSKKKKSLGGPYGSRLAALRRLRQVEYFKNK